LSTPKVSVLLPCYNAGETLEETLASIASQTYPDYEIIAVDDGSTDGSPEMLSRWAETDSRMKIISMEHGGVIAAANAGLQACRGDYIARMDADDRMHPDRLQMQADHLDVHPDTGVVSSLVAGLGKIRQGFQIYLAWLNSLVTDEQIRREMFVESPIANPSAMFRRRLLAQHGHYREHGWPEDYDFWLRLYLAGVKFAKVPEVLLEWRDNPGRLTRADRRYSLENFIRAKAHYMLQGPLKGRDAVIVWGAGMIGRRFSKYLVWAGQPLAAFIDVDPKKIGRTRRGRPVCHYEQLPGLWARYENPVILAAVGARGARLLIREALTGMGFEEGRDWWGVA